MTRSESTSKKMAGLAAKALRDPGSMTYPEVRALAGCVLTQVEAEAAGPKPVKAWGHTHKGKLQKWASPGRYLTNSEESLTRILITAIPRKSVSRKHIVARKPSAKKGK